MYVKEIKMLIARLEEIEKEFSGADFDDLEDLEEEVLEIEDELADFSYDDNYALLNKAEKIIERIKKDNEFYNPEDDLDMMFDDDYDDDEYDDDSTSY